MAAVADLAVRRITAEPDKANWVKPGDIAFPKNLRPKAVTTNVRGGAPLPRADVVITAYTSAEKEALADVMSPGVPRKEWAMYTHSMESYVPRLTWKSPAKEQKCLAFVQSVMAGTVSVLLVGINLHWSTDDKTIPVIDLIKQICRETKCNTFVDHGTAGGVAPESLGDTIVAKNVKIDSDHSQWSAEPWAQKTYPVEQLDKRQAEYARQGMSLVPGWVQSQLAETGFGQHAPQLVLGKDILSVPVFAFADDDDSYGLRKNDPNFGCEEMDVGMTALAIDQMRGTDFVIPKLIAIRNASDPQMKDGTPDSKKQAEKIYEKNGYATTVVSSTVCWAVPAGMN